MLKQGLGGIDVAARLRQLHRMVGGSELAGSEEQVSSPTSSDALAAARISARGGPGGGVITLKDVARVAGVHYSTASRALDPLKRSLVNASTAAQVQEVADRLGYRQHLIARSLRQGRTNTIGI